MGGRDWGRWASWTGVVFGVLLFLGVMVGGSTPDADASPQKVVAYYSSHHSGQQASVFLIAYALIFGLFFAGALRSYLRARSSGDGLIAVGFAGMAVLAASAAVLAGVNFAATDVTTKISPDALQALNVLQNDVFFGLLVGTCVFLIGNGLAIVRSAAALPAWLGWVAAALGVLAVTPIGWIVLLFALPLWSVIVSVLMFVRQAAPAPAAAPVTG